MVQGAIRTIYFLKKDTYAPNGFFNHVQHPKYGHRKAVIGAAGVSCHPFSQNGHLWLACVAAIWEERESLILSAASPSGERRALSGHLRLFETALRTESVSRVNMSKERCPFPTEVFGQLVFVAGIISTNLRVPGSMWVLTQNQSFRGTQVRPHESLP